MKFSIKDFSSKSDQIWPDLVTFTGEIFNEKLHFFVLCKNKLSLVTNQEGETTSWWNSKISKINFYHHQSQP